MFKVRNRHIYFSIFVSELGDFVFLSSIAIFLLNQGYNAFESSSFVAMTTLPNIFLGPILGRIVDQSNNKGFLYLLLTLGIVILEILLLFVTGWFDGTKITFLIPIIFLLMSCLYSPYLMLLNHYIVPKIEENENYSYANMEIVSNIAAVFACFIIGAILYLYDSGYLIVFDMFSFLLSALLLYPFINNQKYKVHSKAGDRPRKTDFKLIFGNSRLLSSLLLIYSYALIINSVMNNLSAFGIAGLKLEDYIVGGALGIIASMELVGSVIYKKFGVNKFKNKYKVQINTYFVYMVLTTLLGIAKYYNNLILIGFVILAISFFAPFWNTNNNLLLRKYIPEGKYGQYFGVIKIPRALMTFVGTLVFARMIDVSYVSEYLVIASLILSGLMFISNKVHKKGIFK